MHRPSPRRLACAVTRAAVASLVAACVLAPVAGAQTLGTHEFTTSFLQLPQADGHWSQIGTSGVLVANGGELLVNDNSAGDCIAFETLLGEIRAEHRVTFSALVRVLTNFGGEAVVVEISRPGLELLVRLHPTRVDVMERRGGGRELFWLGSAPVDLSVNREVRFTRLAVTEDPAESLVVEVEGQELLRVAGLGGGGLRVGRIVFGSLDYPSYGASVWTRVDVSVVPIEVDEGVRTDASSVGSLKASYRR